MDWIQAFLDVGAAPEAHRRTLVLMLLEGYTAYVLAMTATPPSEAGRIVDALTRRDAA